MTATMVRRRDLPAVRRLQSGHTLYWWAEVLFVGIFYVVYSTIRNSTNASSATAYEHALRLIEWQKTLHINVEETIQDWALNFRPLIIASNYFYGSMHFVVTIGAAIFLFRKFPNDYPLFRNTLAVGTALALIGFATFALMPPRLLDCHVSGLEPARCFVDGSTPTIVTYGFVDTLARDPAIWSFNSGTMSQLSNKFAAMPSVHCVWALWCAVALVPRLRRRWAKILAAAYPAVTVLVIVITANHYLLDAVGGFFVFGLGYVIARRFTRAGRSVVALTP